MRLHFHGGDSRPGPDLDELELGGVEFDEISSSSGARGPGFGVRRPQQGGDVADAELAVWLRRRRPTRIVVRPGDDEWPTPDTRPWSQLADLAAGADAVLAYVGDKLVGIWKRDTVAPPPAPDAGVPERAAVPLPAGGAEGRVTCNCAAEVESLRAIVRVQNSMIADVTKTYKLALTSVRLASRVVPADEIPDDDDPESGGMEANPELEKLVRGVLSKAVGANGANMSTEDLIKKTLAESLAPDG